LGYNGLVKTKSLSLHVSFKTYTPRIIALILLAALLALVLTGCQNEPRAADAIDPTGVYTLVSVDGQSVPCSVKHGEATINIASGVFTITADGRCRSLVNFAVPERGDVGREVKASYTQKGAELTMQWAGAGMTKGQIKGNQFTMTNEGMVFSYQK
jgi:hypothetical protein